MPIFKNCGVSRALPLYILFFLLQIIFSPDLVHAEAGVIRLKNGGFINGDIMEVMPQQYATIKLADGTIRKIEWSDIERVDTSATTAPEPAPAAAQAPVVTTPVPVAPVAPATTIKYEMRSVHGVPGLFVPGLIIFGLSWIPTALLGPLISAVNNEDIYDDDSDSSGEAEGVDIAASIVPVIGPWIGLASSNSKVPRGIWIISGTAQTIGATLAIIGFVAKRNRRVAVYASDETAKATIAYLTPAFMGYGGAGLSLRVIHY
jgi:hypothetical protein